MALYLVQHGRSQSKDVDPDQGLTPEGEAEVKRIAGVARGYGVRVHSILHSGKTRAEETVEPTELHGCYGLLDAPASEQAQPRTQHHQQDPRENRCDPTRSHNTGHRCLRAVAGDDREPQSCQQPSAAED